MDELYRKRIRAYKEVAQQRLIKEKVKTLEKALYHSYYGVEVSNYLKNHLKKFRVVFYPTKDNTGTKENEIKILNVPFERHVEEGDILYWQKTDTYWIVYDRDYSELAFLQAYAALCSSFVVETADGTYQTWAALKYQEKNKENIFDKTLVLSDTSVIKIMLPEEAVSEDYFKQNTKIRLKNQVWEIIDINTFSYNNIAIITAKRSFDVSADIVFEREHKYDIEDDNDYIIGEKVIEPLFEYAYTVSDDIEGEWRVPQSPYIQSRIEEDTLYITWTNARKRDTFTISYGDYSKEIVVKSLL